MNNSSPADSPVSPEIQINQFEWENFQRRLKEEQNLWLGLIGGSIGMGIGAALWMLITVLTDFQMGWMAIGVGFLAGSGVRYLGKGFDTIFGIVGGILAGVGCLLGNFLTVLVVVVREFEVPFLRLLLNLDLEIVVELITITFDPIDLLFYGLAIYAGYRASFRRVTEADMATFMPAQ
jgi:hypothetical protein